MKVILDYGSLDKIVITDNLNIDLILSNSFDGSPFGIVKCTNIYSLNLQTAFSPSEWSEAFPVAIFDMSYEILGKENRGLFFKKSRYSYKNSGDVDENIKVYLEINAELLTLYLLCERVSIIDPNGLESVIK
ncbi:hypothetical protein [Leptospira alexanderi]|uniref:hypothetical protein n=1 Tax=Leptospira alexanderi TaxID=100053 RepID=UPI002014D5D4|nr:hypothetical protein [Leptospira alexanderi]